MVLVSKLLAQFATILNKHGEKSLEVQRFFDEHQNEKELTDLARMAIRVKRALNT